MLAPEWRELRGARILVLDRSGNIHSIWRPNHFLTKSYWDFLATMPAISPPGTLGILGLGAGTVAHMIHHYYPEQHMAGWEVDPAVIMAAREFMGLGKIEESGKLRCFTGDALSMDAVLPGGFTSILVDIFSEGSLIPALTQVETWRSIKARLAPGTGARVMANLGQSPVGMAGRGYHPDAVATLQALDAMMQVFDGQVNVLHIRNMDGPETMNTVALTGPIEGLQEQWQAAVPAGLKHLTQQYTWELYERPGGR